VHFLDLRPVHFQKHIYCRDESCVRQRKKPKSFGRKRPQWTLTFISGLESAGFPERFFRRRFCTCGVWGYCLNVVRPHGVCLDSQVAALSLGLLADRFGRRHVTMASYLLLAVSSLALIFAHDFIFYLVVTFLVAIGQTGGRCGGPGTGRITSINLLNLLGAFLIPFILSMEIVGAEKRVYCGIAIEVFFVIGEVLASGTTQY
jgi:hypothetical protein